MSSVKLSAALYGCDGTESFKTILSDTYTDVSGRTEWIRSYTDGSTDAFNTDFRRT